MLSAAVICENDGDILEECLSSLSFCDEIVVVDGGSTDSTLEIARRHATRLIEHTSSDGGIHANKNRAAAAAEGDWILSIDADEIVTPELAGEILRRVADPHAPPAFLIPRKTFFLGRWIRRSGWWPAETVRLWRRGVTEWPPEVHRVPAAPDGTGRISAPLEHHSVRSISEWIIKLDHFSGAEAREMWEAGVRPSGPSFWANILLRPPYIFLDRFLLRLGILDGFRGFLVASSAAAANFTKYARLWEIGRTGELPDPGGRKAR